MLRFYLLCVGCFVVPVGISFYHLVLHHHRSEVYIVKRRCDLAHGLKYAHNANTPKSSLATPVVKIQCSFH